MSEFFWDLNANIRHKKSFKDIEKRLLVHKDDILDEYDHITFRIESLSDYLKVIDIINKRRSPKDLIPSIVFRGMSDYKWKLTPSYDREFEICENIENAMVVEMKTLRPEEFSNEHSSFDLLAKLQHFGIPTRLLDFSTNPLVALYFACCQKPNQSGRVVCTTDTSGENNNELIESICGLYKYHDYGGLFLDEILSNKNVSLYFLRTKIPLMKKPNYLNERIKRQSAIFMIFPNQIYDRGAFKAYDISNLPKDEIVDISEDDLRYTEINKYENIEKIYPIRKSYVPRSNRTCPICFVDSDRFYKIRTFYKNHPDFSKTNLDSFESEFNMKMLHRFKVDPTLQEIPKENMKKYFCSIIVESKYKKRILNELNLLNINEAYLFPELEYTAKNIKEKYRRIKNDNFISFV